MAGPSKAPSITPVQTPDLNTYAVDTDHVADLANGLSPALSDAGGGWYQFDITGGGTASDGAGEGAWYAFRIYDAYGVEADLSTGKYAVVVEMDINDADFVQGDDMLIHACVAHFTTSSGTDLANATAIDYVLGAGFKDEGAGPTRRRSLVANLTSNSTTAMNTTTSMRYVYVSNLDDTVTDDLFGVLSTVNYDATGAQIAQTPLANQNAVDRTTGAWGLALLAGFDTGHSLTRHAQIKLRVVATRIQT